MRRTEFGFGVSGHLLDVAVGHHVDVELGTYALDNIREPERGSIGLVLEIGCRQDGAEHRRIVLRAQCKALVDDDSAKIGVEHRSTEGVFEASDDHRLVDERVERTPQLAPFVGETLPAGGGRSGDDQGLEIGPARLGAAERGRHQLRHAAVAILAHAAVTGVLAERAGHQRVRDPRGQCQRGRGIAGGFLQRAIICRPG
jgi:hypothetical protein